MRLGILTTHPVQYQAPWFRALAKEVDLEVFFAHRPDAAQQGEGFGMAFQWDVDLLSGYKHRFLNNISKNPSPSTFNGCDTPEIVEIISEAQSAKGQVQSGKGQERSDRGESEVSESQSVSISGFSFDSFIVCGWHVKSYWQAARACRKAGIPVFVRGDSQLRTPRSLPKRLVKFLAYPSRLRQFDGFLSVGQRNREYLLHYGVPEDRIFFVPHFVDNERFKKKAEMAEAQSAKGEGQNEQSEAEISAFQNVSVSVSSDDAPQHPTSSPVVSGPVVRGPDDSSLPSPRSALRQQWGIPEDAFCVLFCGKFIPKKRPLDLVEAAKLIAQGAKRKEVSLCEGQSAKGKASETPGSLLLAPCVPPAPSSYLPSPNSSKVHLLFVGSGELGPQLRSSCTVLPKKQGEVRGPWSPAASFAGFLNQSELPRAYAAADVLVLPSDGGETWGLVVNEAMACGLPAIVSDAAGCAPDLIDEGKTGYTFPLGDTRALADRIVQLHALRQAGHDFTPALNAKLQQYSLEAAVVGTLKAVSAKGRKEQSGLSQEPRAKR